MNLVEIFLSVFQDWACCHGGSLESGIYNRVPIAYPGSQNRENKTAKKIAEKTAKKEFFASFFAVFFAVFAFFFTVLFSQFFSQVFRGFEKQGSFSEKKVDQIYFFKLQPINHLFIFFNAINQIFKLMIKKLFLAPLFAEFYAQFSAQFSATFLVNLPQL